MRRIELKLNILLFLLAFSGLLLSPAIASAQPVPALNCVSVEDDGSLTVSWSIPSGTFDGFRLFYRPTSGSVSNSIDLTNTTNSTNIAVSDGQSVGYELYLVTFTVSPPQVSPESNHLRSMMLAVSNAGAGLGIARLDWNRIQAGSTGVFNIYRKELAGTYTLIANTSNTSYNDTISSPYCTNTNLFYRVEFSSGSCVANSSVASGSFRDDNKPKDPVLSYVTIVNGIAEVHWLHSPTNDVTSYVVEDFDAGFFFLGSTGYVTEYTDIVHDPCTEFIVYAVKAEDQCGNSSSGSINYNYPLNTILLEGETTTLCHRKATLTWNEYKNDPGVSSYKVFRSDGGGAAVEIASLDPNSSSYTFVDPELLTAGTPYIYQVAAIRSDGTTISQSCEIQLVPDPEPFTLFEMDYLTVVDNDHIELFVNGEPSSLISTIEVRRSAVNGSSVELIMNEPWTGGSQITISDATAMVNESSYYYSVTAIDACGFELETSNISRSIYLQIEDQGNDQFRLSWNPYEDWGGSLLEYNIYRLADGVIEAGFPRSVPPSQLTFNDLAGDLVANRTTYYVEAIRNDDVASRSNEVLLPAESEVIIANAFRPTGITPTFKPRVKNIEPDSYLFVVYNRWGQLVFETKNPAEGWNGQFNGNEASRDIYAYIITFSDLAGNKKSKIGSVMVVR
jgi:gliding motility-associated-like protein